MNGTKSDGGLHRALAMAGLVLAALAPAPAPAQPRGEASVTVAPYGAPCGRGITCTFTSGGTLVPLPGGTWRRDAHLGALGAEWNTADARVVLLPAGPGLGTVQLGVAASLLQYASLTADGLPGAPLPPAQIALHTVRGSATYLDRISFFDAALPALAPLTVSLGWTLTTAYCSPQLANCHSPTPDAGLLVPGAVPGDSFAYTLLSSSITLPGGTDTASDVHQLRQPSSNPPASPFVTPLILGRANELTHSFTVLNGQAYEYAVSAVAEIVFDGAALLGVGNVAAPLRVSYLQLPYLGSAHLVSLSGTDALGQPLAALQMRTSLGWSLLPETLAPVDEPGRAALLLLGVLVLAWRRSSLTPQRGTS